MSKSVQETYAPQGICFGCGPANAKGLRIRSMAAADGSLTAEFTPEPHHEAFPGVLNGGIIGALLDCHANWAGAMALMAAKGLSAPPCTVTSEFSVKLKRPTPSKGPVTLWAKAAKVDGDKAVVEATLSAGGKVCDTCTGTFVAVGPGHPAYHRW